MSQPQWNDHYKRYLYTVWSEEHQRYFWNHYVEGQGWVFFEWAPAQSTPQHQSTPQYQSTPQHQSTPQYQSTQPLRQQPAQSQYQQPDQSNYEHQQQPLPHQTHVDPAQYSQRLYTGSDASYASPQPAETARVFSRPGPEVRATLNTQYSPVMERQQLHPDFQVRPASFFTEGRMFSILFIEPAGANALNNVTYYNANLSQVLYGEYAHSQVRRFIVVKHKREYCFAVPVFTYGNRGTKKSGVVADEHAIAYSYGCSAQLVADEPPLTKSSIPIIMNSEGVLSAASRIYFGIHHPIQYNVKVKDIGRVHPDWMATFLGYWKMENGHDSQQSPDLARDPTNHITV
ncbi:hypothetical protein ACET3X_007756 [Alternaria dauci]|uniref:DUF6590 domain-containing protein n=1 Tax=Alternaria dauci TaxID=48095 RepID=A0ABR3UDA7_9PLEO